VALDCLCPYFAEAAWLLWQQVGRQNRATASTAMNKDSSRSHSIFTITIESSVDGGDSGAAAEVIWISLFVKSLDHKNRL